MGYTPVFDSVFHGTLCGRWPTLPVWLTILPMADKNGVIDMTPQAMSALTGWPIELLKQAIDELMKPDPESRSDEHDGRRLILIDPHRSWGWRVVNHEKYREKARLAAKSASEVSSGKNKDRMNDRRRPPETAADPLSYSDANTNSNKEEEKSISSAPPPEPSPVRRVFDHWKAVWKHPDAKLDDKRRARIDARLKTFTADQLCDAISGFKHSDWHTGRDPKGGGKVYDKIETLLREDSQVEEGLRLFSHPPRPPPRLEQLSPVERVLRANGVNRDERVVAEQFGSGSSGARLGDAGGDVREPINAGFRRLGS